MLTCLAKCCPNGGGEDLVIIYHLVIIYRQDPLFQLSSRVLRRIVLLLFSLVSFRERPVVEYVGQTMVPTVVVGLSRKQSSLSIQQDRQV